MLIIDPPSGWRFGFPRPYNNPNNLPLEDWLRQEGYPEYELEWGAAKHCRFWSTADTPEEQVAELNQIPS